jgi:hypothetical protein
LHHRKRKLKNKAAGMPKRPISAYHFFANDKRAGVARKNKDAKTTDMFKLLGEMWKNTDASGRAKYVKQAEDKKAEYAIEKAAWDAQVRPGRAGMAHGHATIG